jgi:ankyrin repeat protein/predicted nucleic-acid-binding Zn-ribbon protein
MVKIGKLKIMGYVLWFLFFVYLILPLLKSPSSKRAILDRDLYAELKNTPLIAAVLSQNSTTAIRLLNNGSDPNQKDIFGKTALMQAVENRDFFLTKILLEKGADIDEAITHTLENKKYLATAIIKLILSNTGAAAIGTYYWEDFMRAAYRGDINTLRTKLSEGKDVNERDQFGETALMDATLAGNEDAARFLIENGAAVDAKDNFGETALFDAARTGSLPLIQLLLSEGANINVESKSLETPLLAAISSNNPGAVKLLLDAGARVSTIKEEKPLLRAATMGNPEIIQLLIDRKCDVNKLSYDSKTALMNAAGNGNNEVIKILLANGAEINVKDYHQRTALIYAARGGHIETVKILLKNGADKFVRDYIGYTAQEQAAGQEKLKELLSIKKVYIPLWITIFWIFVYARLGLLLFEICIFFAKADKWRQRMLSKVKGEEKFQIYINYEYSAIRKYLLPLELGINLAIGLVVGWFLMTGSVIFKILFSLWAIGTAYIFSPIYFFKDITLRCPKCGSMNHSMKDSRYHSDMAVGDDISLRQHGYETIYQCKNCGYSAH